MKRSLIAIMIVILTLLITLMPHRSYSQDIANPNSMANDRAILPNNAAYSIAQEDSLCFYRKADGTIVDLRSICGKPSVTPSASKGGSSPSQPSGQTSGPISENPAMRINKPNDPGVLYISGSGGNDAASQKASQQEHRRR